jgi:hypothetical protein
MLGLKTALKTISKGNKKTKYLSSDSKKIVLIYLELKRNSEEKNTENLSRSLKKYILSHLLKYPKITYNGKKITIGKKYISFLPI